MCKKNNIKRILLHKSRVESSELVVYTGVFNVSVQLYIFNVYLQEKKIIGMLFK